MLRQGNVDFEELEARKVLTKLVNKIKVEIPVEENEDNISKVYRVEQKKAD